MSATAAAPPGRRGAVLAVVALVAAFHYLVLLRGGAGVWAPGAPPRASSELRPHRASGLAAASPSSAASVRVRLAARADAAVRPDPSATGLRPARKLSESPLQQRSAAPSPGTRPRAELDTPMGTRRTQLPPVPSVASASASASTSPASTPAQDASVGAASGAFRLPEPFSVEFAYRRGEVSGRARLTWSHDGAAYELRLTAWDGGGHAVLVEESRGDLGAGGPVPRRFTTMRTGRFMRAVNFVRGEAGEPGWIGFSASSRRLPWEGAVHDRLSWVVQLAGTTCAQPDAADRRPVLLAVAGPSGDLQVWRLEPQGEAAVFEGRSDALYGTATSVRLDRAAACVPTRLVFADAGAAPIELDASAPTMETVAR